MTTIWSFLLQTLSVSLVAVLLLVIKSLLGDKLSPRWQYGIWSILALRIVVPTGLAGRYILLPLPLWTETLKAVTEHGLSSAYSSAYAPSLPRFPVPWINTTPVSITDWLFVLYALGAAVSLVWYIVSYARLRRLLRRGRPVSADVDKRIETVCAQYGLRACPAVAVPGLPSAFVCGIFRPVLAVPDGDVPDDKVLLHELLHLKHRDALQSVIWTVFRALHWCNPFMQYVFNRIGNDMESLCDQRVLERLTGEARRDYGAILLSMASEQYPRAPGTTSLSNGGKNIARRIAAIARFKKYPKGMALVSMCIAAVLLFPTIVGTKADAVTPSADGRPVGLWSFELAMASARTTRCTTLAGALDTYAKGLMLDNGLYIAMASPLSEHAALAGNMRADTMDSHRQDYTLQGHLGGSWVRKPDAYEVYNLSEHADGSYTAILVFQMDSLIIDTDGNKLADESGDFPAGVVWLPVHAVHEDAWVVTRTGKMERMAYPDGVTMSSDVSFLPAQAVYEAIGTTGTVTVELRTAYKVDNTPESDRNTTYFGSFPPFDETIKPDARFTTRAENAYATYTFTGPDEELKNLTGAGFLLAKMTDADDIPTFAGLAVGQGNTSVSSGSYSSGSEAVEKDWDRTVFVGDGGIWSGNTPVDIMRPPAGYAAAIYLNGTRQETLVLTAVTADE